MEKLENHYAFLVVGKTQESKEASEGFARYIGVGASKVLAVNPNKAELEKIYGREIANEPEYIIDRDGTKGVRVDIIVQTDPEVCNGIDTISHASFVLFPSADYNKDESKVRCIDNYGNASWIPTEDAKAGKAVAGNHKFDTKYRMGFQGEADLLDFLRKYLYNEDAFEMPNGSWTKKANADNFIIGFENPKKLLGGDVSEVKELIALQPNNKIKLLYGVRTYEGKQYQDVCTRYDMMVRNNTSSLNSLEKNLNNAKQSGLFANTEYKIQELQEYTVEATNLEKPAETSSSDMPWD